MSQPIVYVDTSEVRPGRLEELKAAMNDLAQFVQANEPQLLAYNVYFSDDGTRMSVLHINPNSASLERHMKIAGPKFPPIGEFIRLLAIDVYGRPDDGLVEGLRQKAKMLGSGTVRVLDFHAGICPPASGSNSVAASSYRLSTELSADDRRTGFRRRDPDQAATLFDHGRAVVRPVRMLPGDTAVILDQRLHRLGQADDLDVATELHPVAEESVIEYTQPRSRVAADVQCLHCGFASTHDQTILRVDADEYRYQLRGAVTFHDSKNGMWVLAGERECFCDIHFSGKSIRTSGH